MTDMFTGYDNLSSQYTPSNLNPPFEKPKPIVSNVINKPFEQYDEFGNLIGYWWYYGDTRNLEFDIYGEMVVNEEDIYVDASDFLEDKEIIVTIYNFRKEPIATQLFEGKTKIIFPINQTLSLEMVKGVYYCSLTVQNKNEYKQSFNFREELVLTVK